MSLGAATTSAYTGMDISESYWQTFIAHVDDTLSTFEVPDDERTSVLGFIGSLKADIVE